MTIRPAVSKVGMMAACNNGFQMILPSVVLTVGQGQNDLEKRPKIWMIVTEGHSDYGCDRMTMIVTKGHIDINQRSLLS